MTYYRFQTLLSILLLDEINVIQGGNKCPSVTFGNVKVCAALYEEKECETGDRGRPLAILDKKGKPKNLPRTFKGAESLVVRMGCALQVFTTLNCVGDEAFLFIAPWYNVPLHLAIEDLDNSLTENFGNVWSSIK